MTDDDYFELCACHRNIRFERTADGDIIVRMPGAERSYQNAIYRLN
jgi:hypothetical protein